MRLSDYYYSINIIFKPQLFIEDELFITKINEGTFKVGNILKCQNIKNRNSQFENSEEYPNPVVNAQSRETFRLTLNWCKIIDSTEKLGPCKVPLYKQISEITQLGGTTWHIKGVIAHKFPFFYYGAKSSYMKNTFEFIKDDIISKVQEEITDFFEKNSNKNEVNIEEYKAKIEEEYGFENASLSFAILLKTSSEDIKESKELMFIQVNNWSEENYDEITIGQVLRWNNLIPNMRGVDIYPFNLVFTTTKMSQIFQEEKIEEIDIEGINDYFPNFKSNISLLKSKEGGINEMKKEGFINMTWVVIKTFTCKDPK